MTAPTDGVMGADEARALLARADVTRRECAGCRQRDAEADDEGRHVGCESPDGPGVVGAWRECLGPEESVRALRAVVALYARADGAWREGAEAARAGDVAACARRAEALDAAAPEDCDPDDPAVAEDYGRFCEALDLAAALRAAPLPAPPAPPQRPEAPPDGGTEPGGGGAPARVLPGAAPRGCRSRRCTAAPAWRHEGTGEVACEEHAPYVAAWVRL